MQAMQLLSKLLMLLLSVVATCQQGEEEVKEKSVIEPRIVGGSLAKVGQFPHQISLRHLGVHICGGSIISPNDVLTAAHCVKFGSEVVASSRLAVQAGSLHLDASNTYVDVAAVKVHPKYGNGGTGYDIAVLRLRSRLHFNSNISAIELAEKDPPTNSLVDISGWGDTSHGGPSSKDLLYTRVRSISRNQCTTRYFSKLPETTMCLLHGANFGACHGDSGGPATYKGVLVGVASFILGRCGREAPDGYERVSFLRSWIIQNAGTKK